MISNEEWEKIKRCYEFVKKGLATKMQTEHCTLYSMGEKNPVIRLDIKDKIITKANKNDVDYKKEFEDLIK